MCRTASYTWDRQKNPSPHSVSPIKLRKDKDFQLLHLLEGAQAIHGAGGTLHDVSEQLKCIQEPTTRHGVTVVGTDQRFYSLAHRNDQLVYQAATARLASPMNESGPGGEMEQAALGVQRVKPGRASRQLCGLSFLHAEVEIAVPPF